MEECDYCGASFDDEDDYIDHLQSEHSGELSRIDQKRVDSGTDDGSPATGRLLVVAGVVVVLAGVAYFAFFQGSDPGGTAFQDDVTQPTNVGYEEGNPHYHGTITVTIGGDEIDFSQPQYQTQADAWHFEGGNGDRWHGHGDRVTLEYALETVDIGVTNSTLQFDGTVYDRSEGDTVVYEVNGERVNPEEYVLQEGDEIRVVAEKG